MKTCECPNCKIQVEFDDVAFEKFYEIENRMYGQQINCQQCHHHFRAMIPKTTEEIQAANLKPCPACARQVSKKAVSCPNCGHMIQSVSEITGKSIQTICIRLVIGAGIIFFIGWLITLFQ
jgi:hypothetical protein